MLLDANEFYPSETRGSAPAILQRKQSLRSHARIEKKKGRIAASETGPANDWMGAEDQKQDAKKYTFFYLTVFMFRTRYNAIKK